MPALTWKEEHGDPVKYCALMVVCKCSSLLSHLGSVDEIESEHRKLLRLIQKALASFTGDQIAKDDLQYHLDEVKIGVSKLVAWIVPAWDEIERTRKSLGDDAGENASLRSAVENARAEYKRKEEAVLISCDRAWDAIKTTCATIDELGAAAPRGRRRRRQRQPENPASADGGVELPDRNEWIRGFPRKTPASKIVTKMAELIATTNSHWKQLGVHQINAIRASESSD